jgi:hypothetical protein
MPSIYVFVLLARSCRALVLRILTGLIVELPPEVLRARVCNLPVTAQIPLVGNVLVFLGMSTLVFAHAGWGGPVAFWLTLALVVR